MSRIFNRSSETQNRQALRRASPAAEQKLWQALRGRQILGYKFRRQYSVGSYVIDFYCPQLKLAIEVDGDSHYQAEAVEYDRNRQGYIESMGIRFLRFTNREVFEQLGDVLEQIVSAVGTPS